MNAAQCMSCGATLSPGAPSCHHCGVPVQPPTGNASYAPGATVAMDMVPPMSPQQHQVPAGVSTVPLDAGPANTPQMGVRAAPSQGVAKKNVMTMMAGTAMGVSEAFNAGFKQPFPGWTARVAEPMGPSTGGGKQALQPITITSGAGEMLAIGRVDPVRRSVTLRTFHVVSNLHSQRYGRAFTVNAADWERFMNTVETFFKAMQFSVTEERYVPTSMAPRAQSSEGGGQTLWLAVLLLLLVVLGLLLYILMTR